MTLKTIDEIEEILHKLRDDQGLMDDSEGTLLDWAMDELGCDQDALARLVLSADITAEVAHMTGRSMFATIAILVLGARLGEAKED